MPSGQSLLRLGMLLAGASLCAAQAQAQVEGGPWPDGRKVAVVLTYDDSLPSHLDIAIPALDKAGLKGTFFLVGGQLGPDQVTRWRAAAQGGHELANHTMRHACPRGNNTETPKEGTSDSYDVGAMLAEIRAMESLLTTIDGKPQHGFATPCGQHLAGGVDYLPALRASKLVQYTRGAWWTGKTKLDPMDLPATWFDEKATGADMIAVVEKATRSGGLLVLGFHGVGGDYARVNAEAHAELLAYLKANEARIWTAPLASVLDHASR